MIRALSRNKRVVGALLGFFGSTFLGGIAAIIISHNTSYNDGTIAIWSMIIVPSIIAVIGCFVASRYLTDEDMEEICCVPPGARAEEKKQAQENKEIPAPFVANNRIRSAQVERPTGLQVSRGELTTEITSMPSSVRSSEFSSRDNEVRLSRSIERPYPKADVTAKLSSIIDTSPRPV